jgi:hypothetical protein
MSKIVLTNAYVVFEGTNDFSDHISNITLSTVHDILDVTPVKAGVIYKEVIAGVGTNSVTFDFYQDFASDSIEQFFNGDGTSITRVGTKVSCVVRPLNAAKSATNPEYIFEALITEWTPLNASVGQLSTVSATWPISGAITKDVTP